MRGLHLLPRQPGFYAILLLYAVVAVLFIVRTPPWQAPDEPAHYNYIRQTSEGLLLPVLEPGDWDHALLGQLKTERFAAPLLAALPTIEYQDHQPPLYYWLATPIFLLTDGSLTALRLFSAALGMVTIMMSYANVRLLYPDRPHLALIAMAFVAFLPQHVMIITSVNNDALAGFVMSVLLYGCLRARLHGDVPFWALGLGLGVVVITKTTIYFMSAVVLLTVLLIAWERRASWRWVVGSLAWVTLGAIGFAVFWFGRNISVYGFPDILGLGAHDRVVVGQLRTSELIAQEGLAAYLSQAVTTTFQSFWGQFGWMSVPMHNIFAPGESLPYAYAGALLLAGIGGLWLGRSRQALPTPRRDIHLILGAVLLLAVLVFIYYNTTFVQFQGRYLFSALIPFALYLSLGVSRLAERVGLARLALGAPLVLAALDLYLVWRVLPGALG